MPNPALHAFFLGRALAEVLTEKIEDGITTALSELSKFDAEQREQLRQFMAEVEARATQDISQGNAAITTLENNADGDDLQETLDQLRAEIASLKAELKNYRDDPSP